MRVAIRIPACAPMAGVLDAVESAESAGFDTIAVPDSPTLFRDTFCTLALASQRTSQATLATTVTSFVTHDPIAIASAALTLSDLAPGRVRIGIGAGDSAAFLTGRSTSTSAEIRDGFAAVHGLMRGEDVAIRGTNVRLQDATGPVPMFMAADGPRNVSLAATIADGIITWSGELERKAAQIEASKRASGRTSHLHHVVATTVCITHDVLREAHLQKPYVLRFAQRIGSEQLEELGFAGTLPDDNMLLEDGVDMAHPRDRERAAAVASRWISDDFAMWYATSVCCFGTATEVTDRLAQLAKFGADEVQVTDGGSFHPPTELIAAMATEVIPALHAMPHRQSDRTSANASNTQP